MQRMVCKMERHSELCSLSPVWRPWAIWAAMTVFSWLEVTRLGSDVYWVPYQDRAEDQVGEFPGRKYIVIASQEDMPSPV